MKVRAYTYPLAVSALLAVFIVSSAFDNGTKKVDNAGGTSTSTGAPGESHTCSQSGCHGAGNGNGSSGGLADNAGPGSITVTSNPAFTSNHYVPGAVYHMSVTVSETGKAIFGFNAEILDNSGSTDLHIDNTAGSLTITDPAHTRIAHGYGTGRSTVTHTLNGGLANNTKTFVFDWTAPSTGTVNIYTSGVAGNNDNLDNAVDNVYVGYMQISPVVTTGINDAGSLPGYLSLYPNPAADRFTLSSGDQLEGPVAVQIYALDGKLLKSFDPSDGGAGAFSHTYSTADLPRGLYLLQAQSAAGRMTQKLVIN